MERAFQTALWLLKPHIVFILGDIFDEGTWSSEKDWEDDVRRFSKMFRRTTDTELIVLPGNHDVGFQNEYGCECFPLQLSPFLLLNSMAVLGGSCSVCRSVEDELFLLSRDLNCSLQVGASQDRARGSGPPHYPLYRASNAICSGLDVAPEEVRHQRFEEQYDTLSQEASEKLLWWFRPRLVLSGHIHRSCAVLHENKYPEVSVSSFNWRNGNRPSFLLVIAAPHHLHTFPNGAVTLGLLMRSIRGHRIPLKQTFRNVSFLSSLNPAWSRTEGFSWFGFFYVPGRS
uniref:Metallophosphoesterase 1 n=1 Tax=Scleropages formosus TaxID=113540 RepID=A0A8C9WIF2_SCLFO